MDEIDEDEEDEEEDDELDEENEEDEADDVDEFENGTSSGAGGTTDDSMGTKKMSYNVSKTHSANDYHSMRAPAMGRDYTGLLRRRRGEYWRHFTGNHNNCSNAPPNDSSNDEIILKRAFPAFVPAFDPRPGRTNLPANVDFAVDHPDSQVGLGFSFSQYCFF